MSSRVFKKSWPNYLRPTLLILIALALIYFFSWPSINMNSLGIPKYLITLTQVAAFALSARALYIIALVRSYRLSISEIGIHASFGILPWKKIDKLWEPDQIYSVESQVPKFAFFYWLIRHGNLAIRGKEGSTEGSLFTFIYKSKEAATMGNAIRYKAYKQGEAPYIQNLKTESDIISQTIPEEDKAEPSRSSKNEMHKTTYTGDPITTWESGVTRLNDITPKIDEFKKGSIEILEQVKRLYPVKSKKVESFKSEKVINLPIELIWYKVLSFESYPYWQLLSPREYPPLPNPVYVGANITPPKRQGSMDRHGHPFYMTVFECWGCPSSYKMARISARAKRDFAHLFG